MVSYRTKHLTLAAEFASTKDSVTATPVASTTGRVISAFGVYKVPNSKVAVMARVDITDPNTSTANNKTTRIIGGLSYQLSPNLRLLADLDHLGFESGVPAASLPSTRSQALFQTQITF
jgi:predicted porin